MSKLKYRKVDEYKHPYKLTDMDRQRIEAVMRGELDQKWLSLEEIEAAQDLMFEMYAGELQTHISTAVIQ